MIDKIRIQNYRVFRDFKVEFNEGLNIVVGNNDVGKSTLFEAIHLALTGRIGRNRLAYELTPYLFNKDAAEEFVQAVNAGDPATPPEIIIDLFLEETPQTAAFIGANNLEKENAPGLRLRVAFDSSFQEEYDKFIETKDITLVPSEYYAVEWKDFSGRSITARGVQIATSIIDASTIRLQSGVDYYLQQIIKDRLTTNERADLARAYRSVREEFSGNGSVEAINEKLNEAKGSLTEKELSLGIDASQAAAWERSLTPHLDSIPFQLIGRGDQNAIKILLAMDREREKSDVVLIEEPENHMSPSSLTELLARISKHCDEKQVLIATHNSYVLNKLGLENLILIHGQAATRLTDLDEDTWKYFMKLPGYDTLRIVLSRKAILVEGPSDDLVVQRAYRDAHGKAPMDDGVDVISVGGKACKRFLKLAKPLNKDVVALVDNDGRTVDEIEQEFSELTSDSIKVHAGDPALGHSLEPQIVKSNELAALNGVLSTDFATLDELEEYMSKSSNKTEVALQIFESSDSIEMPPYIKEAVGGGE